MTITTATAEDAALSLDRFSMNDDPLPAATAARSQTTGSALPAVWVPELPGHPGYLLFGAKLGYVAAAIPAAGVAPCDHKAGRAPLPCMNQSPSSAETSQTAQPASRTAALFWLSALLRPIQGFRLNYLPLAMIYFAYGALGLIDVSRDMWIKERLTLSPAELAGIAVWLSLPWTVKMVFGELVDCVPIFGSQRKAYVLIGAAATASGMLTLAGAAGGWIAF